MLAKDREKINRDLETLNRGISKAEAAIEKAAIQEAQLSNRKIRFMTKSSFMLSESYS